MVHKIILKKQTNYIDFWQESPENASSFTGENVLRIYGNNTQKLVCYHRSHDVKM